MSRLAEQITLLQRAADTAALVIYPGAANRTFPAGGTLTAAPESLSQLGETLEQQRCEPSDYRLIDFEAVWLMQATVQLLLHRCDDNPPKVERYHKLTTFLHAAVAGDLANARKSIGEIT